MPSLNFSSLIISIYRRLAAREKFIDMLRSLLLLPRHMALICCIYSCFRLIYERGSRSNLKAFGTRCQQNGKWNYETSHKNISIFYLQNFTFCFLKRAAGEGKGTTCLRHALPPAVEVELLCQTPTAHSSCEKGFGFEFGFCDAPNTITSGRKHKI